MDNEKLSESSLVKDKKTFGLDNVITKLLNKGMCKCKPGVAILRTRLSLTSDGNGYSA